MPPRGAEIAAAHVLHCAYGQHARFTGDEPDQPDFTVDGGIAVEVKLVTFETRHALKRAWDKHVEADGILWTDKLQHLWTVTLDLPSRGEPDPGPFDVRTFRSCIVGWLASLERAGMTTTRGLGPPAHYEEPLRSAVDGLRRCMAMAHDPGDRGGCIDFSASWGSAVLPGPEPVLLAVEEWLDGSEPQASVLRRQMAGHAGRRHAFLVLDDAIPEQWNLIGAGGRSALPERAPHLPEEVDALWICASPHRAWRWDDRDGWRLIVCE